jgi:prophage maintenance system killer protein
MNTNSDLMVYQTDSGALEVRFDGKNDTVWLSLQQIADLFERDKSVISRHLRNIFTESELVREATVAKNATVQSEGSRTVTREIEYFNLDVIISVGYRVNSSKATRFRQWATRTLREHLTQGFTVNQARLAQNVKAFEAALALVQKAAASTDLSSDMGRGLVDVLARYAQTFLLLQQYDEGLLDEPAAQSGGILAGVDDVRAALARLKADLIRRGEATELFALERGDGLAALLGNLDQSVFGAPAYPSVESKAAHLLYFVVKNHPFTDGNKRSGAFLFVDFLNQNRRLLGADGAPIINDVGLAALTLLIAESAAEQKEVMIKLVMNMLAQRVAL